MALIYAKLIKLGLKEFKNIPEQIKEEVKEVLIKAKREDLIKED